jgi:flagella basal body P-ring formation protein FlgA
MRCFVTPRIRAWAFTVLGGIACLAAGAASAQAPAAPDFRELAQNWLHGALQTAQPADARHLRLEAVVGNLDARLRLAPCGNIEPYLPVGARLWGKTRVGLRCVDGVSRWNVSLPVTVKAVGTAWVVKNHVPAGSQIGAADVMEAEVDWAEEFNPVLKDRSLWLGQTATRMLTTGQTLRQGMVKPAQVFQAGAQVRVVAQGAGFEISSDAQALSAGVVGQLARVRMDSGRIASGVVLDMRTVKIDL